jgi:peroxiredoxin
MPRRKERANPASAALCFVLAGLLFAWGGPLQAQGQEPAWTTQEKPISKDIDGLRELPDDARAAKTKELALEIRALPAGENRATLADELASLSTEGDFGHDTLQQVATTLAAALRDYPVRAKEGDIAEPYIELASLARYEHVQAALDNPQFTAASAKLQKDDARRESADFTLTDLHGQKWSLQELRGKVVLVNFWATWCPPCRKEMPDLEAIYERFHDRGLVILAISDETETKVAPFISKIKITYPVMLDPGRKVNELFQVDGIPKSFVYDRNGKLVTESIDMRTQRQFLQMLAQAGLQ